MLSRYCRRMRRSSWLIGGRLGICGCAGGPVLPEPCVRRMVRMVRAISAITAIKIIEEALSRLHLTVIYGHCGCFKKSSCACMILSKLAIIRFTYQLAFLRS